MSLEGLMAVSSKRFRGIVGTQDCIDWRREFVRKKMTKEDSMWVGAQNNMLKALVGPGGLDLAPNLPKYGSKLPKYGYGSFTLAF